MPAAAGLPCAVPAGPRRRCLLLRPAASREPAHCTVCPSVMARRLLGQRLRTLFSLQFLEKWGSAKLWVQAAGVPQP